MRRIAAGIVCLSAILPSTCAHAAAPQRPQDRGEKRAVRRAPATQTRDLAPQSPPTEHWRYRFHNGHWWYWREDGSWAYWTGKQWYKYSPESYRRWYLEWRVARNEAEVARLKTMMRSRFQYRTWVDDPDSYLPFANERGGDP